MDPEIGLLTYFEGEESYWQVSREFDFCIFNDKAGVSAKQKELLFEIEQKYEGLKTEIEEIINNASYINAKKFSIGDDLEVNFIEIHNEQGNDQYWSVIYIVKDHWQGVEVGVKNWKPFEVLLTG